MRKILLACSVIAIISFASCKKYDETTAGATKLQNAANGWWVTIAENGSDYGVHVFFSTYNLAGDYPDSLWLDDLGHIWDFKIKVKIDPSTLAFSATDAQNESYDSKVTIENAKILLKAGHSASGVITDSIYMEAHFDDDPNQSTWTIAGVARTGLIEDDY